MEYRSLGRTGIKVSAIGLGTMTFGEQNTEAEGHEQLDHAIDQGVNLLDTAEMYSVPPRAETYGATERIIGSWLKKSGKRGEVVLATKVAGPGAEPRCFLGARRQQSARSPAQLPRRWMRACSACRPITSISTSCTGRAARRISSGAWVTSMRRAGKALTSRRPLDALSGLVRAGKIRHIGLSNETPRVSTPVRAPGRNQGTRAHRPRSRNPYSLLNRSFEIGLAEMAIREDVGLLAYSPLGFGVLSGKFLHGARPPESRIARWTRFSRLHRQTGGAGHGCLC